MGRQRDREFQLGDYWLSQRSRSRIWHRTWFDQQSRQTKRVSLGTEDLDVAKEKLTQWFLALHQKKEKNTQETALADILMRYWENHGKNVVSARNTRSNLAHWVRHFGNISVADATNFDALMVFRSDLEGQGFKPQTINNILRSGRAAFRMAWKRGELSTVPPIEMVPLDAQEPLGRPLSSLECKKLLDEAYASPVRKHVYDYILMAIGTAARPSAILDLTAAQMDFEHRLIHLNPAGRAQNKKIRPTVRMPELIADHFHYLQAASGETPVIAYGGKKVRKIRDAWYKVRAGAGMESPVTLYSFRHTVARFLRSKGVPAWEVAGQLGHKIAGMTDRYAPFSPDYLKNAEREIQGYLVNVACHLRATGNVVDLTSR